mmetsp:Transcript_28840/g.34259  ORF Transcript_28840/g.34259 Transcript_28840/m.34259 type:complete len:203 (+) Transcript_28840:104-712(+)
MWSPVTKLHIVGPCLLFYLCLSPCLTRQQQHNNLVQSFSFSSPAPLLSTVRLNPHRTHHYRDTSLPTTTSISRSSTIPLFSINDDDDINNTPNTNDPNTNDPNNNDPPQPPNQILAGVAQAKLSGILCIATLLSEGAYTRNGGDPSAVLDGILGFPPGGPIILAVGTVSGLFTLWRIQPVLKAVRDKVEEIDARRSLEDREE